MTKGSNIPLTVTRLRVDLVRDSTGDGPDVDASALLVTGSGKVRSDDDFVFFNQPKHRSGAVWKVTKTAVAGQLRDGVEVDLLRVEDTIDKIVFGASADGGTFGQVQGLHLVLTDAATGTQVARFDMTDASSETAYVSGEVYRRAGAWKFRAVGQGYASGLAGLATDFGITVDDAPASIPPSYAPPPAPQHLTPPGPGVPDLPPPTGRPLAGYATPPVGSTLPQEPQHVAPGSAAASRTPGTVAVNLDGGRVSLQKNQRVSLVKTGAPRLDRVQLGLGWDPAARGRSVDLDASAIVLDAQGKDLDLAWFASKKACRGAVVHQGDNLTGQGDGDDEVIRVELSALPTEVAAVVFTINSFSKHLFTDVRNAYCRLLDSSTGTELVRFDLTESEPRTGVFMCVLRRAADGWEMEALGDFHDGRSVKAMRKPAAAYVAAVR